MKFELHVDTKSKTRSSKPIWVNKENSLRQIIYTFCNRRKELLKWSSYDAYIVYLLGGHVTIWDYYGINMGYYWLREITTFQVVLNTWYLK